MRRELRPPFVVVIAGALAACARDAPPPATQETAAVISPPDRPREASTTPLAIADEAHKPSDRDRDGFLDLEDRCPDEPGDDRRPESMGCRQRIRITENPPAPVVVRFEGDTAIPSKSSDAELDVAAEVLKGHPEIKLVRIEGHDDPSNGPRKALALSKARADAVVKELVKRGIDKTRLRAVGIGGYCPLVESKKPEERARNRRAHFKVELTDQGATEVEVGCAPSQQAGIK